MKKLIYLAVLAVVAVGCSVDNESLQEGVQEFNLIADELCGDAVTKNYENDLGYVEVTNSATTLYVKVVSNVEGALMNSFFAWAETFEDFGSNNGTLPPAKMDEKMDVHGVTTFTYEVPLSEINTDCVLIAVKSIFKANQGEHWVGEETAGQAEWRYFEYCIQSCTPPPPADPVIICESAYAYSDNEDETLVNYYNQINSSQNWGWYNEVAIAEPGQYEIFEIWAAAGQNDLGNGTLVGHVKVYYDGSTEFTPLEDSGFSFSNIHVYVGTSMPTKRLAPGHFARNSTSVAGNFFVIIHLEVCAEESDW